ncbi:hypothetical protein PG997_014822 [Apiospora hydei]|uniref:Uncharacterized protein n=1 Tax=Apiospora hydei TaxID=1337664 RepID=A0ABR1UV02_9PEZI
MPISICVSNHIRSHVSEQQLFGDPRSPAGRGLKGNLARLEVLHRSLSLGSGPHDDLDGVCGVAIYGTATADLFKWLRTDCFRTQDWASRHRMACHQKKTAKASRCCHTPSWERQSPLEDLAQITAERGSMGSHEEYDAQVKERRVDPSGGELPIEDLVVDIEDGAGPLPGFLVVDEGKSPGVHVLRERMESSTTK